MKINTNQILKHKHKWQFVEEKKINGYLCIPQIKDYSFFKFVCECGKVKIVKEK